MIRREPARTRAPDHRAGGGYAAATWCLGFAAVSAWQVVAGPPGGQRFAAYTSGLVIVSVLVGVLKLAGAPLLLGLLLAVAPALLGHWGLLPS